jgi:hypothetical protein
VNGRVVTLDASGKLVPVPIGTTRIGQNQASFTSDGSFQVRLSDAPQSDSLLEIAADHYLHRFLRLDDPALVEHEPIELTPKMKIIVVPSTETTKKEIGAGIEAIRRGLENELGSEQIELLSNDKLRDDVVRRLYDYQENGALYDPKTLARVGNFYGATDGVFWTLERNDKTFTLECKLVNLSTAKVENSVTPTFPQEVNLATAAILAGDMLLSQMAQAKILTPKDTATVRRKISLRGYSLYIPRNWTLWISMLPEGNDEHFPQRRISTHGDDSWYAPDVYAGEDGLPQPVRFEVYMVLTDPDYSNVIQAYLDKHLEGGLNMNAWSKERFRILDHISVTRPQ